MQLQRHVGIFRRVLGGAVEVDLVEGDLLRALAADVFEVDGFDAQVPVSTVESMSCRVVTLLST